MQHEKNDYSLENNVGLLLKDCQAMKKNIDAVNKEVAAVKKKSNQVIAFLKDIAKTLDTIGGGYNKVIEATTSIALPKKSTLLTHAECEEKFKSMGELFKVTLQNYPFLQDISYCS
jgi:hypothetical protein